MKPLTAIELAERLFKIHTHAELEYMSDPASIVYKKDDIIALLKELGCPQPDFYGYSKKVERELLSCPGDTIKETLAVKGWSKAKFTRKLQGPFSIFADVWNLDYVNKLLKGELAIDEYIAADLERVLEIPKQFWLNREKNYREGLAKLNER